MIHCLEIIETNQYIYMIIKTSERQKNIKKSNDSLLKNY